MLTTQQQALIKAIEELELAQVQNYLLRVLIRISLIRNKDRQCPLFVMEFLNGGKTSLKRMKRGLHYHKKKTASPASLSRYS